MSAFSVATLLWEICTKTMQLKSPDSQFIKVLYFLQLAPGQSLLSILNECLSIISSSPPLCTAPINAVYMTYTVGVFEHGTNTNWIASF